MEPCIGLTRRTLLRMIGGALGAPLIGPLLAPIAACGGGPAPEHLTPTPRGVRELAAGPKGTGGAAEPTSAASGVQPLGLSRGERDGVLVLPDRAGPVPLILMLHGAGGTGRRAVRLLGPAAPLGCAIVAPDARGQTWDAVMGKFGPDVRFIERALAEAGTRCSLDGRYAVAGFSDGATYALALGRANGDRFSHILAFSPGFLIQTHRLGTPRIYISHGRQDAVLPIASCSRVIVPQLEHDGYDVLYREFEGAHEAPPTVVREGIGRFLGA